jgi:hypothetical protein
MCHKDKIRLIAPYRRPMNCFIVPCLIFHTYPLIRVKFKQLNRPREDKHLWGE